MSDISLSYSNTKAKHGQPKRLLILVPVVAGILLFMGAYKLFSPAYERIVVMPVKNGVVKIIDTNGDGVADKVLTPAEYNVVAGGALATGRKPTVEEQRYFSSH